MAIYSGRRQLVENDDYDDGLASYIEWTCPRTACVPVAQTICRNGQRFYTCSYQLQECPSHYSSGDFTAISTGLTKLKYVASRDLRQARLALWSLPVQRLAVAVTHAPTLEFRGLRYLAPRER